MSDLIWKKPRREGKVVCLELGIKIRDRLVTRLSDISGLRFGA